MLNVMHIVRTLWRWHCRVLWSIFKRENGPLIEWSAYRKFTVFEKHKSTMALHPVLGFTTIIYINEYVLCATIPILFYHQNCRLLIFQCVYNVPNLLRTTNDWFSVVVLFFISYFLAVFYSTDFDQNLFCCCFAISCC